MTLYCTIFKLDHRLLYKWTVHGKLHSIATDPNSDPREHVSKYKNIRTWMVEFLRKSESRGDKIGRVYSICITKSIN